MSEPGRFKFRAWDGEKMVSDIPAAGQAFVNKALKTYSEAWEVMQSTGMSDKNGKEIFEGDFLRTGHREYGKVIYTVNIVKFEPCSDDEAIGYFIGYQRWEIIGNIHENPELAEKI